MSANWRSSKMDEEKIIDFGDSSKGYMPSKKVNFEILNFAPKMNSLVDLATNQSVKASASHLHALPSNIRSKLKLLYMFATAREKRYHKGETLPH